jgi:hypothetical protein
MLVVFADVFVWLAKSANAAKTGTNLRWPNILPSKLIIGKVHTILSVREFHFIFSL